MPPDDPDFFGLSLPPIRQSLILAAITKSSQMYCPISLQVYSTVTNVFNFHLTFLVRDIIIILQFLHCYYISTFFSFTILSISTFILIVTRCSASASVSVIWVKFLIRFYTIQGGIRSFIDLYKGIFIIVLDQKLRRTYNYKPLCLRLSLMDARNLILF